MQLNLEATLLRIALGGHPGAVTIAAQRHRWLTRHLKPHLNRLAGPLTAPIRPTEKGIARRTEPIKMPHNASYRWVQHLLQTLRRTGRLRLVGQLHAGASIDGKRQKARFLLEGHSWKIATDLQLEAEGPLDPQPFADILPWLLDQGLGQQIGPHQQTHLGEGSGRTMDPTTDQTWCERIDATSMPGLGTSTAKHKKTLGYR